MKNKNIGIIINLIKKLENCKNADEFYVISTRLYYRINEIVFNLECKNLKCEEKESEKNV